jgi:protease-4
MSLETDLLLDRRRLKRRLMYWRAFAFLAAVVGVVVALGPGGLVVRPHVARVVVSGLITEDRRLTQAITRLARDTSVKALEIYINSPGGSVAGGESLYDAFSKVAATKPVVAVMGGLATSAAYMAALPAARIFARDATLTGSIGVLLQTGEISGLLERVGISAELITSAPLKGEPSLLRPLSPEGREALRGLVRDLYDQFVAMVATARHLPVERARALADGRAYTGRNALQLGLIDAIGGEPEARAWLARERDVPASLPIVDVEVATFAERTIGASFGPILQGIAKSIAFQRVSLDGAWAVWQPSRLDD